MPLSVQGVHLRRAKRGKEIDESLVVSALQAHDEMRPAKCGQQLEPFKPVSGGQIDGAEAGQTRAEQFTERHIKDHEDRDTENRLPIHAEAPGSSPCIRVQRLDGVGATTG